MGFLGSLGKTREGEGFFPKALSSPIASGYHIPAQASLLKDNLVFLLSRQAHLSLPAFVQLQMPPDRITKQLLHGFALKEHSTPLEQNIPVLQLRSPNMPSVISHLQSLGDFQLISRIGFVL